jgi:hypothetical protein
LTGFWVPYDHVTAAYLAQAGVPNDYVLLTELGIRGNGHMMMLEKNNEAIAAVIEQWLKKTVPTRIKSKAMRHSLRYWNSSSTSPRADEADVNQNIRMRDCRDSLSVSGT